MHPIFEAFLFTLLHSIWQAAVLWFIIRSLYYAKDATALSKRNMLLLALLFQLLCSVITFIYIIIQPIGISLIHYKLPPWKANIPTYIFKSIALWAYTAIILFKASKLFIQWNRLRALKITISLPDEQFRLFTTVSAHQMGIKQPVSIWFSEKIITPLTYGFLRPVILFPISLVNHLSVKEVESLIIHELSHIKEKDFLYNGAILFCEVFYFFNPFILLICKNVKLERESNCDEMVIKQNYPHLLYAEALLKTARIQNNTLLVSMAATGHPSMLRERIKRFTTNNNEFKQQRLHQKKMGFAFLLCIIILTGICLLIDTPTKTQPSAHKNELVLKHYLIPSTTIEKSFSVATVSSSQPVMEKNTQVYPKKKSKRKNAAIKNREDNIGMTSSSTLPPNYNISQVAIKEPIELKLQMTEENSKTGKIITQFTFTFRNGQWEIKPNWQIIEKNVLSDSVEFLGPAVAVPFHEIQ